MKTFRWYSLVLRRPNDFGYITPGECTGIDVFNILNVKDVFDFIAIKATKRDRLAPRGPDEAMHLAFEKGQRTNLFYMFDISYSLQFAVFKTARWYLRAQRRHRKCAQVTITKGPNTDFFHTVYV